VKSRKSILASAVALAGLASGPALATDACYLVGQVGGAGNYLVLRALKIGPTVPTALVGQPQPQTLSNAGVPTIPQQVVYALHGKGMSTGGFVTDFFQFNAVTGTAVVGQGAGVLMTYTGSVGHAGIGLGTVTNTAGLVSGSCSSRDPGLFPASLSCRVVSVVDTVDDSSTAVINSTTFTLTKVPRDTDACNWFWVPPNPVP
jgi:hypothetical protein